MTDEPPAHFRAMFAAAALAAAAFASPAAAQQGIRLFDRPTDGRQFTVPPVARFVAEDGQQFVLDRSQGRPLLKFENSPEIWALQAQPGPRGDVIYKNDLGEPVLRATRLGGITVFTATRPSGSAAALAGQGSPLRLSQLGPQELFDRLAQASARASRAARHGILFDAEANPNSSALIADAATVASLAIVRISSRAEGRTLLLRLRRVFLTEGRRASVQMQHETLVITVAPGQGMAGRPSSERIVTVAANRR
ncbi:DUF4908 domain-containing protein [Phenylobacterium deserti]|uniref:DUF4908 domain-containing protein n=1 Tax=Phenylobacterium deserti TaxID=1914756 RepID=A0A328AVX0_9CAUL|nr:DUF4908 domain-containing protein [Phenylobacterium deserti]RAK57846.1 DUF4908 domain-containing protein [Phenylobacterium deserti]